MTNIKKQDRKNNPTGNPANCLAVVSNFQGRIENAPSGRSVSASVSPIIKAPMGVRLAGLSTNGHPTASAGAILWAAKFRGKLNGEIKEQAPTGTRFHIIWIAVLQHDNIPLNPRWWFDE